MLNHPQFTIILSHSSTSEVQYRRLKSMGAEKPYTRRSPQIHMPRVLFRPILSMQYYSYHKLARWLAEILDPTRRSFDAPLCKRPYWNCKYTRRNFTHFHRRWFYFCRCTSSWNSRLFVWFHLLLKHFTSRSPLTIYANLICNVPMMFHLISKAPHTNNSMAWQWEARYAEH